MVPKSESLCKKKMNCLGYVLTFRSLLRVFDEGKEEDVERGLCKEPTTLAKRAKRAGEGRWYGLRKGKKMVPKSESLCKGKMNCLGYVLTFRSLLRVFDEGKEEDVEKGLCKEPTTLTKCAKRAGEGRGYGL